ncbi:MAG: terminase small subunit, partial [Beijerinckiaceae bacterium]
MLYERLLKAQKRIFLQPKEFLAAAVEYFEWASEHPLEEEQLFHYKGGIVRGDASKLRAFTRQGLATYLGIPASRLETYRGRGGEWAEAVEMIEQVMYEQKFSGAAAGLLNASLIGRDLGLAEKTQAEVSAPNGQATA